MYFYLSKTLGLFAIPSILIPSVISCGLLLWLARYTRLGQRVTIAGFLMLLIAGATPLGTALLLPLENRFPQWDATRGAPDGIIVLGGALNTYVSRRRNNITFGPSGERLIAALDLHRRYPAARIVFSGGNASVFGGRPESELAVRFLEDFGVTSDLIAVDAASRNTTENALGARDVAAPRPSERWVLVTSASHMPRAIGLFRAVGFPVEAYPVDWKTGGWRDLRALPVSLLGGFTRLDLAAHEWLALLVDWATGRTSTLFPGPAR